MNRNRRSTVVPTLLALLLAAGWATREVAFAQEKARAVQSTTVNLDDVKMAPNEDQGRRVGQLGVYVAGDTPGSTHFVTGRYVIDGGKGKTPHAPHTHAEEEVMVIEQGRAEIFCDGKTTKVGPGSVMYTTPNAPHGITNLGDEPVTFYFIKWQGLGSK